jgi:hypothetical protein
VLSWLGVGGVGGCLEALLGGGRGLSGSSGSTRQAVELIVYKCWVGPAVNC